MDELPDLPPDFVKDRYHALDPIWASNSVASEGMIPLRKHIKRLVSVTDELSESVGSDSLDFVRVNLRLAASLEDLWVDTDIDGTAAWCRFAPDFEEANSEVTAKHIAGVIVFQLVWIAYEAAGEIASTPSGSTTYKGKGALVREVIFRIMRNRRFPHLRQAVFRALELNAADMEYFRTKEMRSLIVAGSIAAIGAEHLRCFRNSVIHGDLVRPLPEDWGESADYNADDDPAILQFHANIRMALLLIQILLRSQCNQNDELKGWHSDPKPSFLVLTQLHCDVLEEDENEIEMPFEFLL